MLVTFSHRPLLESCYPKAALANSSAHRLYSELLSLRHRFRYSTSIVFVLHPFFTPVFRWLCKVVRIRHCSHGNSKFDTKRGRGRNFELPVGHLRCAGVGTFRS